MLLLSSRGSWDYFFLIIISIFWCGLVFNFMIYFLFLLLIYNFFNMFCIYFSRYLELVNLFLFFF